MTSHLGTKDGDPWEKGSKRGELNNYPSLLPRELSGHAQKEEPKQKSESLCKEGLEPEV